jgi:uncharacterized protein (DUF488 family)
MSVKTIGYEGSDIADFISVLKHSQVDVLVDIRDVPISRKKGFSKKSLSESIFNAGIEYRHMKALGDPKEGRLAARAGEMQRFRRIFCDHMDSDQAKDSLQTLAKLAEKKSICLMCFERDHKFCHRSIVVEKLLAIGEFQIRHIGVPVGFSRKAA